MQLKNKTTLFATAGLALCAISMVIARQPAAPIRAAGPKMPVVARASELLGKVFAGHEFQVQAHSTADTVLVTVDREVSRDYRGQLESYLEANANKAGQPFVTFMVKNRNSGFSRSAARTSAGIFGLLGVSFLFMAVGRALKSADLKRIGRKKALPPPLRPFLAQGVSAAAPTTKPAKTSFSFKLKKLSFLNLRREQKEWSFKKQVMELTIEVRKKDKIIEEMRSELEGINYIWKQASDEMLILREKLATAQKDKQTLVKQATNRNKEMKSLKESREWLEEIVKSRQAKGDATIPAPTAEENLAPVRFSRGIDFKSNI